MLFMQITRDFLDGCHLRCRHEGERFDGSERGVIHHAGAGLDVCFEVAVVADDQRVLADCGEQHELVRNAATHHAGIGEHGDDVFAACAPEDALIRDIAALVICFQIRLIRVEGIRVLHRKLAYANESAASTGLVAELGLQLIDHERILGVALGCVAREVNRCFLVRHAEHHVRAHAVGQANQLLADAREPAALLPEVGGQHDGEEHFLTVDGVHLLADDALDLLRDASCGRQKRIHAGVDLLDVAAAHHERVALNGAVRGFFFVALAEQFAHSHNQNLPDNRINIDKQFIIAQKERFDKGECRGIDGHRCVRKSHCILTRGLALPKIR